MDTKLIINKQKGLKGLFSSPRQRSRLLFYTLMLLWPVVQLAIFYVWCNFDSIVLAFQNREYKVGESGYVVYFAGFSNFSYAWNNIIVKYAYQIWNAAKFYLITFPVTLILSITFSFYIYKKYPGHGFFKVMLYMPSIISGLVLGIIFRFIVCDGWQEICSLVNYGDILHVGRFYGLIENPKSSMAVLIFYNIWVSFGMNILLYSGAMSGIDESIVESCHLDGCNLIREMWYISIPMIFSTIVSLVITSITGVFSNQMGLLTLFGKDQDAIPRSIRTIGYTIYMWTVDIKDLNVINKSSYAGPQPMHLSAYGLIVTAFVVPIVFGTKKLLNKYGPSAD